MAHNTEPGASMPAERREAVLEARWQLGGLTFTYGFPDQSTDRRVNEAAADFVRRKIAGRVRDPETACKLMPRDHPLGSKRLCVDTEYFEAFNRPNVHLVDLREEALVAAAACARNGMSGRRRCSASPWPASPTCSSSPGRAARRC